MSVILESEDEINFEDLVTAENEIFCTSEITTEVGKTERENETAEKKQTAEREKETAEGGKREAERDKEIAYKQIAEKGSWVLAKYGNASYVGQVEDRKEKNVTINILRKRGLYFVYPDVTDRDEIEMKDVQQVLEEPHIQRGKHYFQFRGCQAGMIIN